MARSIKKNNIIKDGSKYYRKLSHSRTRLEVKRRLKKGEWDTMPLNEELTIGWNVCDYIYVLEKKDMLNAAKYQNSEEINDLIFASPVIWYKGKYRLVK